MSAGFLNVGDEPPSFLGRGRRAVLVAVALLIVSALVGLGFLVEAIP